MLPLCFPPNNYMWLVETFLTPILWMRRLRCSDGKCLTSATWPVSGRDGTGDQAILFRNLCSSGPDFWFGHFLLSSTGYLFHHAFLFVLSGFTELSGYFHNFPSKYIRGPDSLETVGKLLPRTVMMGCPLLLPSIP